MKIIKIHLRNRSYDIIIGYSIIKVIGKYLNKLRIGHDAYIITNAQIKNKFGREISRVFEHSGFSVRFKSIPNKEESKSIAISSWVIKDLAYFDRGKQIFILAFGGGVVGDLAGFVASIYKRGIPYIQIPTTLLAQIDSSIGGKTAVDLPEGKNLVGAFYQPRLVLSDIKFLNTLDQRQIRTGLAEAIKYGIIKDKQLFSYLENRLKDILALRPSALEYVVGRCSQIKANIVSRDEREERGIRTVLNFGHTVGHAIEAAAKFRKYTHGEAIALGMLVALDISMSLNLINKNISNRIENLIKAAGLPLQIKNLSFSAIINAHYRDKKFIGLKNRFVLINDIGKTKIVEDIPIEVIKRAIKNRI